MDGDPCDETQHGCPVGDLFQMLGKTHMLDILHIVIRADGAVRFNEIEAQLSISPNTLSSRLKTMAEAGLVRRTAYNEIPPRVDYEATPKARGLRTVFQALNDWAAQNTLAPEITS